MRFALALALAAAPLAFVAAPAPAQAQEAAQSQDAQLHAWFEARFEEQIQFSPLGLTGLGRKERYGEINDFSLAEADRQLAWLKASVEEMERTFDYDALSPKMKLAWDVWKYEYESAAEGAKWRDNGYVFSQMGGMHAGLPSLM